MLDHLDSFAVLLDVLKKHANTTPDQPACVFQPRGKDTAQTLTYEQLSEQIAERSQLLLSLGYEGKVLALLYPTGLDFVVNFLACLNAGVIAVPLNVTRNAKQLERTISILEDANVQAILTTEAAKEQLATQLDELVLSVNEFVWLTEGIENQNSHKDLPHVSSDSVAFIQYTSGSTSKPKGVMVSHGNIIDNMKAIQKACGCKPGVVIGGWLPQFHDMGLIGHMLQPLYMGGTYVFMPPLNFIQRPSRWLRLISDYKIHCSASPNFGFEHCINLISDREDLSDIDLSHWKVAINGSEPVSAETMRVFASKFAALGFSQQAFTPCYGMAETTLMVSGGPMMTGISALVVDKDDFEKGIISEQSEGVELVCCGEISAGYTVKIVEPETRIECKENQIGEIWCHGPSVAKGYLNNLVKTISDFKATLSVEDGKDYLRTGDLGYVKQNRIYIVGRIKEMLIIRGRNVFPYDLERSCNRYEYANGGNGTSVFTYQDQAQSKLAALVEINKRFLGQIDEATLIRDIQQIVFDEHEITFDQVKIVAPGTIPKTTSGKVKRTACAHLLV